ncbi:MAG TPA: hypothetical protein ENJ36_03305 [Candidatus Bathyarchaeota archaeon]|nr:hypothetical protein [Candidatus Bathyarchaeota archaeon]
MNLRRLVVIVLVLGVVSIGAYLYLTTPRYTNEEYHAGDLLITDVYEITDTKLTIDGSILVKGEGKLIAKNSMLKFNQESNSQYRIEVGDWGSDESPELYLENTIIDTNGKWMYVSYAGATKVTIIDCDNGNIPWHSAGSNVDITLKNTDIGLTSSDNVTIRAENCKLFFEFVLKNCNGTYALPKGKVDELDFVFDMGREKLQIETKGCSFRDWGVTLDHHTNITYRDTEITIGMNAGTSPTVKTKYVEVSGLKAKTFSDFTVDYDTNHLRLIDTKVWSWYPQAFNGVTVDVSDADLADVQWNSNNSTVIVRDSKAYIAVAKENVTYRFIDSLIEGDVSARDNSTIYLENTNVRGKINVYGNGRVFIDGEPYTGS